MQMARLSQGLDLQAILAEVEAAAHVPPSRSAGLLPFAQRFFERSSEADRAFHTPAEWAELVVDLFDFAARRPAGQTLIRRVVMGAHRSVLQIVTPDLPFLVDTVSMHLAAQTTVLAVIHPVLECRRDADGSLQAVGQGATESVMHFELADALSPEAGDELCGLLSEALGDVQRVVADWQPMRRQALDIADHLAERPAPLSAEAVEETARFLRWLAADHFVFLGYREYVVQREAEGDLLVPVPGSGLGLLSPSLEQDPVPPRRLNPRVIDQLSGQGTAELVIVTRTNARSPVHRNGHMDYIAVVKFDAEGHAIGEQRFLGLLSSRTYLVRPQDVPLVRQRVESVLRRSGLESGSYSGRTLRRTLDTLPRDELFQSNEDDLYVMAMEILELLQHAHPRLLLRRDQFSQFYSCQVFVPRNRFSSEVRERIEAFLREALHATELDSSILMADGALARLYVVAKTSDPVDRQLDIAELEAHLQELVRSWHDELRTSLRLSVGDAESERLFQRFGRHLAGGYSEQTAIADAVSDLVALDGLGPHRELRSKLYLPANGDQRPHFKIYHAGQAIALSNALPILENLGMKVLTERLYLLRGEGPSISIQDFELEPDLVLAFPIEELAERFADAFEQIWRTEAEDDGFNRLILAARLTWRQVMVLRAYCKYLLQAGVTFSQQYMESAFYRYPAIAGLWIEAFLARFDPERETRGQPALAQASAELLLEMRALLPESVQRSHPELAERLADALGSDRATQLQVLEQALAVLLDGVESLDDDRILRRYLSLLAATLRVNYFQSRDSQLPGHLSLKFDSRQVPELPRPVPFREIFVYSPRVEGIHLRFGPVARGGLRWSDRREDFRTEVLGLVKAQMVKNTVIVPVGSKGGFYVKCSPPASDREAWLAEGIRSYQTFIGGLLDITDNLLDGAVVPPPQVVRYDSDDPYLVVAADKGTATFSDIANAISVERGFWLGDAFASGGSNGYDHKQMGITARGAWESVKRHFRALGQDCQQQPFTCVGIGDMSGDVFGNGMLLSGQIRLVAAFDHRHVFIDPDPDTARAFSERQRLFGLSRSSWEDYDRSLISAGGGVWPRHLKTIPVSAEAARALGLDGPTHLAPTALISAILAAPVDLLWNGGIGTYVKASTESHDEVGDRANNALRIDASQLRCRIVGEGGNLGLTQRGRIEAALGGVLLNTDFIDNSAGVDTSDHEVNIKILLDDAVQRGELTTADRNTLLAQMTDEIGELVLWDNYRQNQTLSLMESQSLRRVGSMAHFIRTLEAEGLLDRQVEFLPSEAEIKERRAHGVGLTRPELAVLLSYDKIRLYQQLLDSDVPEDPYLSRELIRYFPQALRDRYAEHMQRHRLKREIIATAVTNSTINRMGTAFILRLAEDTGKGAAAIAKAFTVAREILDARELWSEIEALDGQVPEKLQVDANLIIWSLLRHMSRWLLNRGGLVDIAADVERYQPWVSELRLQLPDILTGIAHDRFIELQAGWEARGIPSKLAIRLARMPMLRMVLDMVEVAQQAGRSIGEVAQVFYALGESLSLDWLRSQIEQLPVEGRWHAQARGSLLDELSQQHRALALRVLSWQGAAAWPDPTEAWLARSDDTLSLVRSMLAEISMLTVDYPIASVVIRRLALLARTAD
ncbi:NAD-glutamate dehydrogenase [Frateuria aurantia]